MADRVPVKIWNRTDLTSYYVSQGTVAYQMTGVMAGQQIIYADWDPPGTNQHSNFPSKSYKGETIPAFAVCRALGNPVWYKETLCIPVGRPDDQSMNEQQPALHFFNGPTPIAVGQYGDPVLDLPTWALCDLTALGNSTAPPYGNIGPVPNQQTASGFGLVGLLVGLISGAWALHPASDIINAGPSFLNLGNVSVPGGTVSMYTSFIPYTIVGQRPNVNMQLPRGQFEYDAHIMLVGKGALGFAAASATPS